MSHSLAEFLDGLRSLREEAANETYQLISLEELPSGWSYEVGVAVALSVCGLSLSACCCMCYLRSRARSAYCDKFCIRHTIEGELILWNQAL